MDDKNSVGQQLPNQSSIYDKRVLYLSIFLVFLIVTAFVLFGACIYMYYFHVPMPFGLFQNSNTVPIVSNNVANTKDTQITSQLNPSEIHSLIETQYRGLITAINPNPKTDTGKVQITLQNLISNAPDKTAIFEYDPALLNRLGLTETVAHLKVGDKLEVTQWTDLTSEKDDGLIALSFTKLPGTEPRNKVVFEYIKKQISSNQTIYDRPTTGIIKSISRSNDGKTLTLTVSRDAPDKVPSVDTFEYAGNIINTAVLINNGVKKPQAFGQLKNGDTINLLEINDYSKEYENSIVSLTFIKL